MKEHPCCASWTFSAAFNIISWGVLSQQWGVEAQPYDTAAATLLLGSSLRSLIGGGGGGRELLHMLALGPWRPSMLRFVSPPVQHVHESTG